MGSKFKRFLAVLLTVMMLISMVPVSTMAAETAHDHTHETATLTQPASPVSAPNSTDPEDPEDPNPDVTDPQPTDPVPAQDLVCYQPGDANSDGEVQVKDAFYVLYHSTFAELDPSAYPMNHNGDYDGDGNIDKDDALLVLEYVHGLAELPAYRHAFLEPTWNWELDGGEVFVSATFVCSCPVREQFTLDSNNDISVSTSELAATCTEQGNISHVASVEFGGVIYTDTYTVTHEALGHSINGTPTCTESASCDRCDYTVAELGHTWNLTGTEPAGCDHLAVFTYTCDVCGAENTVEQTEGSYVHQWVYTGDVAVEDEPCTFAKAYECSECGEEMTDTDVFSMHTYSAALTTEATCQQAGLRTLTCTVEGCGHTKTETVPADTAAHTWDNGVTDTETGIITYTCTAEGCGHTKTAVDASIAAVSKENLAAADELKVGQDLDVSISMDDQTVDALKGDVSVNVSVADESATAGLSEEQKARIGDNPVYDFTMSDETGTVSTFDGLVTISLPYTLKDGDDVDCIHVWFISDDGVELKKGTYSNGYVTFSTDHFSYYTVTQLTPEQRCEYYGCSWEHISKDATCTAGGYSMYVCKRCGVEDKARSDTTSMLNHEYKVERVEPTCTQNGAETKICANCSDKSVTTLFKLNHVPVLSDSVAATCTEAGKNVYTCSNSGCTYTYTEQFPALGHDHQYTDTVAATCTATGYDVYTCSRENCGDTLRRNATSAIGHSWVEAENAWAWTADYAAATVTLVCSHDESHTTTQKAVVTESVLGASCTAAGSVTYTAKVTYNNVSYENVQQTQQSALGHSTASGEWISTSALHYHVCDACGVRIDQEDHNWGGAEITVAPSCVSNGKATYACTVCGYSRQETVPATGIHTDTDGDEICDICGFSEQTCTHDLIIETDLDLSGYALCEGARIVELSCECGQYSETRVYGFGCNLGEATSTYDKELPNGRIMKVNVYACQDCGAIVEEGISGGYFVDEVCMFENILYRKVSIGDKVIAEYEVRDIFNMGHDLQPAREETIAADGFCGIEATVLECPCGGWILDNSTYHCQWVFSPSNEPNTSKFVCSVCGATRTEVSFWVYEGCFTTSHTNATVEYNGTVLFQVNSHYRSQDHNFLLESYVMKGDSCTEGMTVRYKCADCGVINEYFTTGHEPCISTVTDLSSWGNPCMASVTQSVCPCGSAYSYHVQSHDPNDFFDRHSWMTIREEDNAIVSACMNCGYTMTSVRTESEKDEYCEVPVLCAHTISDGGEHSVTLYSTEYYTNHNYDERLTMLGESCSDGIDRVVYCTDCGFEMMHDTYYDHQGVVVDSIDLSEFGGCNTIFNVYTCMCGYNTWMGIDNENCQWTYQGWENGYDIFVCVNCGIVRKSSSTFVSKEGCVSQYLVQHIFSKNNKTLDTLTYTETGNDHRYIYELTLHEGAESCNYGYDAKGTCTKCGHVDLCKNYHGCDVWTTQIDISPDGALCGSLVVEQRNCACGQHMETQSYWEYSSCNFVGIRNEETGEWYEVCENCGVVRKEVFVESYPGKVPCSTVEIRNVSFFRDNQLVFGYNIRNSYIRHDCLSEYLMLDGAESCSGGYTVRTVCQACGWMEQDFHDNVFFDCEARPVAKSVALSREDICADIIRVDWSCACGANSLVDYLTSCNFTHDGMNEETGAEMYRCRSCNLRYDILVSSVPVPDNTCQLSVTRTVNYYVGDEQVLTQTSTFVESNHDYVTGFRLQGETCSDGYTVYNYCSKCGEIPWEDENVRYNDCYETAYCIARQHIYDSECGSIFTETYSCACGKNFHTELWTSCEFQMISEDGQGNSIQRCVNCGLEQHITHSLELKEGATCDYWVIWTYQFYADGEPVGSYISRDSTTQHKSVYHFELLGTTCDDGYTVRAECTICGQIDWEDEEVRYGCSTYYSQDYGTTYFADTGVCEPYYAVTHTCACGRVRNNRIENNSCYFQWVEAEDGNGYEQCAYCGLIRENRRVNELVDSANCMAYVDEIWTFRMGDTVLGQFDIHDQWRTHTHLYTYELLGETCEDGYNRTGTCYYCGNQEFYGTEYGCCAQPVMMQPVVQRDDICDSVYFVTNTCACGMDNYTSWRYSCNFDNSYQDNETGIWHAQCPDCGLIRQYYSETVYDTENCTARDITYYTFYLNGTECGSYTLVDNLYAYHHTTASFKMLGDSCEDGYYVIHTCQYCDYSRTDEGIHTEHYQYETTVYDTSALSGCGIRFALIACPCGMYTNYNFEHACNFHWTENTDANGNHMRACDTCGLQYSYLHTESVRDIENCIEQSSATFWFYLDNEVVLTCFAPLSYTSHHPLMTNAELNDPELGCAGGYTATYQCPYCLSAHVSTVDPGDNHTRHDVDIIYVDQFGGCKSTWYFDSCACGEVTGYGAYNNYCNFNYSYEYPEINGISHTVETRVCETCGFKVVIDSHSLPSEDPCASLVHEEITFLYNDTVVKTYSCDRKNPNHDWCDSSAELLDGSTDCTTGVRVERICTRCGSTEIYDAFSHVTYVDEAYGLGDYGSIHDGELAHYVCACGQVSRYDLRGMTCDLDYISIPNFIDGAINEVHNTADSNYWIESNAWLIKCAVTDPECPLTIRMSEYWLADPATCTATEYQIWEMGYNEATGTCQRTFQIPTGYTRAYHSYDRTEIYEDDGAGTYVTGYRLDCPVCGSYYIDAQVQHPDGTRNESTDAVNMLNDGRAREYHSNRSFILVDGPNYAYWYITESYNQRTYADGSIYWDRSVYTYDSGSYCYRTCTTTNSNSDEAWIETEESHVVSSKQIDYATCSQFGHYYYQCDLCDYREAEIYTDEPYRHDWCYDEDQEYYYCSRCGLSNNNGADGNIVVENLSNAESYIVGYWVREPQDFDPYAAIVKYNTESGEEEVVLLGEIDFTYMTWENDGITAISANKARLDATVQTILGDYVGNYAVRIIFVPADDQGLMDYAVTFDTCYTDGSTDATEETSPAIPEEPAPEEPVEPAPEEPAE